MRSLAIALMLTPAAAFGAGFELADQSVTAAGAGGTGAARSGDPSAVWYNPAALADGEGARGGAALFLGIPRLSAASTDARFAPVGQPASSELGVATPFAAHLGYSKGRYGIGLYAGTSHGTSVAWPEGWWGRFDALSTSIRVIRAAPSFAVRLGPVRIGVGVHVDYGTMEIQRALDFVDTEGRSQLHLSGVSAGADASLYWQAKDWLAFGLTYQSRTVINLDGQANFTVPDSFAGRASDSRIKSQVTIPDRFALGTAITRGRFTIYADATLTLWSARDVLKIDFENPGNADVTQPQNWRESFSLRAGLEAPVHARLKLRGGAYYDHQAAPSETLAASSPDMSRIGLSIGGSVQLHRALAADLSYSVAILLPRDSSSADAILATYSGHAHFIGIAFRAMQPKAVAPRPIQTALR